MYNNIIYTYGLKKKSAKLVENRMELDLSLPLKVLKKNEWELYLECIYSIVPFKFSF